MFNVLHDLSRAADPRDHRRSGQGRSRAAGSATPIRASWTRRAIEAKGLTPFEPWLTEVRGLKVEAACQLYSDADRLGIAIPFAMFVGQDRKASDQYALNIWPGRPRDARPRLLSVRRPEACSRPSAKYLQHLTNMLTLAGEANAAARAKAIIDFETKIAQVHWTRAESRDANKTYNKMTLAELQKLAPGFDLPATSEGATVPTSTMSSSTSRARSRASAALSAARRCRCFSDQLLVRSLDTYAGLPARRSSTTRISPFTAPC